MKKPGHRSGTKKRIGEKHKEKDAFARQGKPNASALKANAKFKLSISLCALSKKPAVENNFSP